MVSQLLMLHHGKAAGPVNRYHMQTKNSVPESEPRTANPYDW